MKLAIALTVSLLLTLLIMGGAIFGFLYWRKGKLNKSNASSSGSQDRSILRSLGNRFSGNTAYKQAGAAHPTIQLNGIPPNNYTSDDFELNTQYDNQTFEQNENYQNFTDFSGSREVGIDVGPFEADESNTNDNTINIQITNIQDNQMTTFQKTVPIKPEVEADKEQQISDIRHLSTVASEVLRHNSQQRKIDERKVDADNEEDIDKYFETNKENDPFYNYQLDENNIDLETEFDEDGEGEEIPQKEMSREDFDNLFNKRFSEILDDKSFETLFDKKKEGEQQDVIKEEPEDENDITGNNEMTESNMFGNIEQNFPELFGEDEKNAGSSSKSFSQRVTAPMGFAKNVMDQSDISSVEMELTENEDGLADENDADSLNLEDLKKDALFRSGLNLSMEEDEDENGDGNDYKDIEINAIKNMKINNNNNFVMNDEASNLKNLILTAKKPVEQQQEFERRSLSLNDSLEEGGRTETETEDGSRRMEEFDADEFDTVGHDMVPKQSQQEIEELGIGSFPNPRTCRISVAMAGEGLGIHLCGTKNHMIKNIEPDSPAEQGGLKPGDKILVINGENVEEAEYTTIVERLKDSIGSQRDIDLLVMNIIEYNIFKKSASSMSKSQTGENERSLSSSNQSHRNDLLGVDDDHEEEEDLTRSSHSSDIQTKKKNGDIESFVNNEFNPFHDVPNEMFSPFLHYTSIPPPANFQAGPGDQQGDQFFGLDQDPFSDVSPNQQFGGTGVTAAQKISPDNPAYYTNSDDASSTSSSTNNQEAENQMRQLKEEDLFFNDLNENNVVTSKEMVGSKNASNFDEDFLKSIPTKPKKKLNELIMRESQDNGKMFQSVEFSNDFKSPKANFMASPWDMSNSDYSESNQQQQPASSADFERF